MSKMKHRKLEKPAKKNAQKSGKMQKKNAKHNKIFVQKNVNKNEKTQTSASHPSKAGMKHGNNRPNSDAKQKKGNNKGRWQNKKVDSDEEDFGEVESKTMDTPLTMQPAYESNDETSNSDNEQRDLRELVKNQNRKKKKSGGFQSMGLSHNVFKGITRKGYKVPTPIQRKTIPILMEGKDVVGMARTGSGKTAAFLIPMFEKLQTHCQTGARALIMSPTRELALQTLKFAKELGKYTGLRAAVVLGGDRMEEQFAALHSSPDIIIATPGRFMHVAVEMNLKLKSVQYAVFDEADRLFEMGFQEQLNEIINRLSESRQTLLFSATLPKLLVEFAKAGLHDPTLIRLDVDAKLSEQLKLSFLQCRVDDKLPTLLYLLQHVIPREEQTVIFASTKHHVEYINQILEKADISCTYIYSSLDPTARKISIAKFQHGKVKVMIVTDLAARGIDIPLLDNVINFHFPAKSKLFVHRVGRVARAGRSGVAYSLVSPDEIVYVYDLHVFLGRPLKFAEIGKSQNDEDGLYGAVPQSVMDDAAETLRLWHEENYDISSMIKVCNNAYGQYIRSRPQPAPESVKRVKDLEKLGHQVGTHPLFGVEESSEETERVKLLNALKSYKSNTTIFEINTTAKNASFGIMKKKRDFHGKVVHSKLRKMEEYQSSVNTNIAEHPGTSQTIADDTDLQNVFSVVIGGKKPVSQSESLSVRKSKKRSHDSVRDEENYISYRPADYQSEQGLSLGSSFDREASTATLDIAGDDDVVARKTNNAVKWDRKKKKFVKESNDDPKRKKIRTESGAWIPASYKSSAYQDWVKRSKTDTTVENRDDDDDVVLTTGADNPASSQGKRLMVLGGADFKRRHRPRPEQELGQGQAKNRNKFKKKRSELKRPEQIIKARKIKAKKEAFQKGRQKKPGASKKK